MSDPNEPRATGIFALLLVIGWSIAFLLIGYLLGFSAGMDIVR